VTWQIDGNEIQYRIVLPVAIESMHNLPPQPSYVPTLPENFYTNRECEVWDLAKEL